MNTDTVPVFNAAMTEITHDVIAAVAEHPDDTPARRVARQQAVADTMMSLEPQTPMETMLAGHCVVFDHMILESAHQLLNCPEQRIRLRIRPQICASARLFLAALGKFEQWNARSMDRIAAEAGIETRPVPPARRAAARTRPAEPARAEVVASDGDVVPDQSGQANRPSAAANQLPPAGPEMSPPEAPDLSLDPVREPADAAAAQIRPDSPLAAERERAVILARRGQTTAAIDEQLLALLRETELERARQRQSNALAAGGEGDATESNPSPALATRVEELV